MSQLKPNPYLSIKDSIVKLEDSYLEEHFITSVIEKVVKMLVLFFSYKTDLHEVSPTDTFKENLVNSCK